MDEAKVLEKIRELAAKQLKPRPIGIDTLALILHVQEIQLKPILAALACNGHVVVHVKESQSRRRAPSGTVEYIEV